MLRLAVEGGGCSGFKYVYEFEKQAADADEDVCVLSTSSGLVVWWSGGLRQWG